MSPSHSDPSRCTWLAGYGGESGGAAAPTRDASSVAAGAQQGVVTRLTASSTLHLPSLGLARNTVHLWFACIDVPSAELEVLSETLVADEHERAGRFRFRRDCRRFIAGRGILRYLLSRYLNTVPVALIFRYGHAGKPAIAEPATSLRFNLSHAGAWALYAIGRDRELGVDIELREDSVPWSELAPMVFSGAEQSELKACPVEERPAVFLRGWTRKEAYIKARGAGLSLPLKRFDVPLGLEQNPVSIDTAGDRGTTPRWWLYPIDAPAGYMAALVAEGAPVSLSYRRWPGSSVSTGLAA
ncbi:MAG: 4'-phosphopantetheinyl transferase family protein [Gammaproteobacteria bacterium]